MGASMKMLSVSLGSVWLFFLLIRFPFFPLPSLPSTAGPASLLISLFIRESLILSPCSRYFGWSFNEFIDFSLFVSDYDVDFTLRSV